MRWRSITPPASKLLKDYAFAGIGFADRSVLFIHQEIASTIRNTSGMMNGVPVAACDQMAPINVNVSPAYAHSRRRGANGCNSAMAANNFASPKILSI